MVINVNNSALPAQVKEALRANDKDVWGQVKKGLAPRKELSFIPTLEKGTTVTFEQQIVGAAENPAPRQDAATVRKTQIAAQIQRALRNHDAEGWRQVKKGLMPQKDISSVQELAPGTVVTLETKMVNEVAVEVISTTPPEEQPSSFQQAASSYAGNNMAPDDQNVEELLKIND